VSARNFVSIRLSLTNKNNNGNILAGINKRIEDGQLMDTDTRTRQERDRIQSYRLSVKLNPQISYMTTGELAQILQEIGRNEQDKAWSKIGDSIQKMASIRNAVMHNQLVDEQALRTLYDLRGAIYRALNR
jgi:hypothetical protein